MSRVITLGQFIIEKQSDFPFAKGGFSRLIRDLAIAAKIVNREVNKAGLVNILGETGDTNVQGEQVKKLDVFANEQFIAALNAGGECCMIVSEENDDVIPVDNEFSRDAKYIVCIDPLDGSSNIDVNVSVGTIFAIYRRLSEDGVCTAEEALQSGKEMVAAGY
ncbi:MAG: class 1 fructose-bisphosphatase, partial [bacterium]